MNRLERMTDVELLAENSQLCSMQRGVWSAGDRAGIARELAEVRAEHIRRALLPRPGDGEATVNLSDSLPARNARAVDKCSGQVTA